MGFIAVDVLIIFKERKSFVVSVVGKEIGVLSETAKERCLKLCTYCSSFPCDKLSQMYSHMNEFFDKIKRDFPNGIQKPPKS